MIVILILSTLLISLYGLLVRYFRRGLQKALRQVTPGPGGEKPFCSILVPFRNEAANLAVLIEDLSRQDYPSRLYEVLLVNDHSEDDYEQYLANLPSNCRIYSLTEDRHGKKAALALGEKKARGRLLLQTDADCRLPSRWLSGMVAHWQGGARLTLGAVAMVPLNGFWSRFAALDFLSLQASGLGSAGQGRAFMGSAASMAFTTDLRGLLRPAGAQLTSGDDVFLIQAAQAAGLPVGVEITEATTVITAAPDALGDFLKQRVRWGAKTSHYPSVFAQAVALLVIVMSLLPLFLLLTAFWDPFYLLFAALFILLKALIDYPFLRYFARLTGQSQLLRMFWPVSLLYPFYILYTSFLILRGSPGWKGR